jgi:hypothetical protein
VNVPEGPKYAACTRAAYRGALAATFYRLPVHEWTPEEANTALAEVGERVERVLALLDQARHESHPERGADHRAPATNGRRHLEPAEDAARTALAGLEAEGVVLHDPDRGLVDFHALAPSRRAYWLCWAISETEVGWWHWPDTDSSGSGTNGRTPLAEPPE